MSLLWASLATVLFSLFDYFGYNTVGQKPWTVKIGKYRVTYYRIVENLFQVYVCYLLVRYFDFLSMLMFLILWLTFVDDLLYYAWCDILKVFKPDIGAFKREVLENQVTWAWWTIVAWFNKSLWNKAPMSAVIIILQAAIGLDLVITIQLIYEVFNR